jgi:hypothetical protein
MKQPTPNLNLDGSFDLGWGTGLLCFSLVPYFNAVLPRSTWASPWTSWVGYLPLFCGAFAPWGIPKIVKRYITCPRTGYVANPKELKLIQLVTLMVFGLALGSTISLPFVVISDISMAVYRADDSSYLHRIVMHGVKLVACASLTFYLGRKILHQAPLLAAGSNAGPTNERPGQAVPTDAHPMLMKAMLLMMLVMVPALAAGLVLALMYMSKSVTHDAALQWPQMAMLSFLVGTNAILYLMINGVSLMQQRWRWLVLALMLISPIIGVSAVPYPAPGPGSMVILEQFPPVMLSVAAVWFLSGLIALASFILHNALPAAGPP